MKRSDQSASQHARRQMPALRTTAPSSSASRQVQRMQVAWSWTELSLTAPNRATTKHSLVDFECDPSSKDWWVPRHRMHSLQRTVGDRSGRGTKRSRSLGLRRRWRLLPLGRAVQECDAIWRWRQAHNLERQSQMEKPIGLDLFCGSKQEARSLMETLSGEMNWLGHIAILPYLATAMTVVLPRNFSGLPCLHSLYCHGHWVPWFPRFFPYFLSYHDAKSWLFSLSFVQIVNVSKVLGIITVTLFLSL